MRLWKLCYDTHRTQLAVVPTKRSYEEAIGLDSLVVISEERLFEFDREWHQHKINLLRSPPASGKTTFAKRFKLYTEDNGHVVWHISMTHVSDIPGTMENKDSFNAAWKKFAGETWTNCLRSTVPTDILIDEAQMLYDKAPFFWNDIKGLQDYPNHNLRVILLSMYSDRPVAPSTPIDFTNSWGMECLRLKRTEFDQLVNNFIKFVYDNEDFKLTIPNNVLDAIFNSTAGHPHLVRKSLEILKDHFRRSDFTTSGMLYYLVSHEYYLRIKDSRVFDALRNLKMTNDNVEFLRNAYHQVDSDSTFSIDSNNTQTYNAAQRFKRSGLITEAMSGSRMQFAAPVMHVILGSKLFTAQISLTRSAVDFDAFLLLTLERMRPSTLRESLSHNGGVASRLIERQWQTAWLTAATTAVPSENSISPDVGAVYGSPGYLDFYVDGKLQWGVELMREGKRLADHVARFASDGRYNNIPLGHWAIIDFRHNSTVPRKLESNVWYAMYADDYKTITVRRQGHKDVVLTLCGDNLLSPFRST